MPGVEVLGNFVNLLVAENFNFGIKNTWQAVAVAALLTTAANCCSFVAAENIKHS